MKNLLEYTEFFESLRNFRDFEFKSGPIEKIEHDEDKKIFKVFFKNGKAYAYEGIRDTLYDEFLNANKPMSLYNKVLKGKFNEKII
jgi:hypothetical protein